MWPKGSTLRDDLQITPLAGLELKVTFLGTLSWQTQMKTDKPVQTDSISFLRPQFLLPLTQEILRYHCRYQLVENTVKYILNLCYYSMYTIGKHYWELIPLFSFPNICRKKESYSHANADTHGSSRMPAVLQDEFGRSKNSHQFFPGRERCSKLSGWIEKFEEAWTFAQKI